MIRLLLLRAVESNFYRSLVVTFDYSNELLFRYAVSIHPLDLWPKAIADFLVERTYEINEIQIFFLVAED